MMRVCPICGDKHPEEDFIGDICSSCACNMF